MLAAFTTVVVTTSSHVSAGHTEIRLEALIEGTGSHVWKYTEMVCFLQVRTGNETHQ